MANDGTNLIVLDVVSTVAGTTQTIGVLSVAVVRGKCLKSLIKAEGLSVNSQKLQEAHKLLFFFAKGH